MSYFELKEKLTHSVGIELTYSIDQQETSDTFSDEYIALADSFNYRAERHKVANCFQIAENDPGCVEVPTRVLSRQSDVVKAFTAGKMIATSLGLVTKTEHISGCGGHIHVGDHIKETEKLTPARNRLTKLPISNKLAFVREYSLYPAIGFAFGCPQDDLNVTLLYGKFPKVQPVLNLVHRYWNFTSEQLMFSENVIAFENYENCINMYRYGIAIRPYTIEIRFFDMAKTVNQQLLHLKYALAWATSIDKRLKANDPFNIYDAYKKLPKHLTVAQAITQFKKHVELINLDWEEYKVFTANIKARYEWLGKLPARTFT